MTDKELSIKQTTIESVDKALSEAIEALELVLKMSKSIPSWDELTTKVSNNKYLDAQRFFTDTLLLISNTNAAMTNAFSKFEKVVLSNAFSGNVNAAVLEEIEKQRKTISEFSHHLQAIQNKLAEIGSGAFDYIYIYEHYKKYFDEELQKEKYGGKSALELFKEHLTEDGKPIPGSLWDEAYYATLEKVKEVETAPHINVLPVKKADIAVDKVNTSAWRFLESEDGSGQLAIGFDVSKNAKRHKNEPDKQIPILYAIDFSELEKIEECDQIKITKRLTPTDRRVYTIASALFNTGNNIITASQIARYMSKAKDPSGNQINTVNNSITKMMRSTIYIDNSSEIKHGYHKPEFKYDGALLPAERITAVVNGTVTESAIHLFREPPMMTFAKGRKEFTTVDVKVLQTPLSKTDQTILLEDYLIERIARAKNSNGQRKILFSSIFEHVGINEKNTNAKKRAKAKIDTILNHYVECELIQKYVMKDEYITVSFADKEK